MAITDAQFDTEGELQTWAFANSSTFFGNSILLPGFRITTAAGKHGLPDGFAFNFDQRAWWVIECELLTHGVWTHIAEQITRFVVAARNPATLRQVRDKLFEKVLADSKQDAIANALRTNPTRLLQQLELFLESGPPSLAVLIDETDQDLLDFCNALDITTEIYRIKKFIVNGQAEYYSPDKNQPGVTFESTGERQEGSTVFEVIEQLGGAEVVSSRNKCYKLKDGRIAKIQYSKLHEKHQYYWYGINPSSYSQAKSLGCTDFIFVMGDEGFVTLPLPIVDEYTKTAYVTKEADNSVRHYHVYITSPPDVALKGYSNAPDVNVAEYFQTLN
ncbi:MAG TPA: hypothetical protein VKE74_11405 [Gemmataceae bacterium]|nr:hypothetical protein [Gemmataceae bacterium]